MIQDNERIQSFHAHIYYDPGTREIAAQVRQAIGERFDVTVGSWHDKPVGPHPKSMFQVAFDYGGFADFVPWLMLNRVGLDVLVHPNTDDDIADHGHQALWLGEKLPINFEFLHDFIAERARKGSGGA